MGGLVDSPVEVVLYLARVRHHGGVFRQMPHARYDVDLLVSELAEREVGAGGEGGRELDLPRDVEDGHGVRPLPEHSVEAVDSARAGRDVYHGELARRARVALCCDCARLLVVVGNVRDFRADAVVQVHRAAPRNHKHVFHAVKIFEPVGDVVRYFYHTLICRIPIVFCRFCPRLRGSIPLGAQPPPAWG